MRYFQNLHNAIYFKDYFFIRYDTVERKLLFYSHKKTQIELIFFKAV